MDGDGLRTVMSRFATGVTVMTTAVDGEPHGMTANALTSVSLSPLLVLVCVSRDAAMHQQVQDAGSFALSILAADQQALSDHFADPERSAGSAGFADVTTSVAVTGAPIVDDALGYLDCELHEVHEGGDHVIVVGRVVGLGVGGRDRLPLLYHRSTYTTVDGA